ncbi:MAG: response regulator [Verrucomicrobiaceae bacterium]|nr:response regulator [Verrucomicrobiaceae bacterium]NCF94393.1 response regulator [Verrucomicrobiaceae bacterium]
MAESKLPQFQLGRKRLLLVDDEPDLLSSMCRIMKFRGYDVDVAGSGLEAIEMAQQTKPDGVLLDIRMPGIDGVETYRRLRPLCPEAFVIFISGFSDRLEEAHGENPLGVFSKPVDLDMLCSLIKEGFAGE